LSKDCQLCMYSSSSLIPSNIGRVKAMAAAMYKSWSVNIITIPLDM